MTKEITYKILDAYRKKVLDKLMAGVGVVGLAGLVASAVLDNTPMAIGGGTLVGAATVVPAIEYTKAYMEARLDYLKNNKFTQLEE